MADDLHRGAVRLGFADPRPLDELAQSWPEALGRLSGRWPAAGNETQFSAGGSFKEDAEFHLALLQGDAARVRSSFDALLVPFEGPVERAVSERYRIIVLLGSALGRLVGQGQMDEATAHYWMDFDDLRQAPDDKEFCLLARSRLPVITSALSLSRRWSVWVAGAMEYIRENYGHPITLELAANSVGVTPKRLSRLFIEELGQGFSDYLIGFRIEQAKILLAIPGTSIKQVSVECGYPDPNYFSRLFKKVTGTTPTEFAGFR